MNRPYLRTTTIALLKALYRNQRQPVTILDLSQRAGLCERATCEHLRYLEGIGYITVDRRERPHAYELSAAAISHLLSSEQQFVFVR
jgi:DNA-binding IclR family transcriptional regulator